jgi:anti-sigma regulatory factor (Ser/Thr protein kinase)
VIDVRDSGIGTGGGHREHEPASGGLGLPLIEMLADRLEINSRCPGTSVRMTFELR